ncbi:unnamed protein product [Mytilus edulis]|uniref:Uncharacterized protein n=1 Tax=Mytilus edulis TaxID=6550 RepID=A0A8S3SB33_MYTED|nr:unnamed protein product [Mytilus edulis]
MKKVYVALVQTPSVLVLNRIYLSNNDLTVLEENIFQDLTALETLDLSDNPLTCCELLDLKLFLQNKNLGDAGAMCHGTSTMLVDFNFTDCTAQESDVRTTMETTTDALHQPQILLKLQCFTTQDTQLTSTVTLDTHITQESDVRTTMETTTDALASTPNTVETTVITTQDTQLTSTVTMDTPTADNIPLNTTSSNAGSRSGE